MRAYFFNEQGLFRGSREVRSVPARATEKKPPETWPPDIPRWTGSDWGIVQDQTHRVLYHKVTRSEYVPRDALEQVDMRFYTETEPPGSSKYEYWDDAAKAWLIDASRENADKAVLVRARLALVLPDILSDPSVSSMDDLRQKMATRETEILAEAHR